MRTRRNLPVAQKVTQEKRKAGAHLYVIRSESGVIKIGRSNTPRKRMADLQAANGHKLKLVKVLRDRGSEEAAIHAAVQQWRRNGEWFHDTFECRDILRAALGVEIRFLQEHQEEDGVVNTRREAETAAAIASVVASIHRDAERKQIRRAQIVEEKAAKERRRIELKAIAADIATYSDAP